MDVTTGGITAIEDLVISVPSTLTAACSGAHPLSMRVLCIICVLQSFIFFVYC